MAFECGPVQWGMAIIVLCINVSASFNACCAKVILPQYIAILSFSSGLIAKVFCINPSDASVMLDSKSDRVMLHPVAVLFDPIE